MVWTARRLKERFFKFFSERGHEVLPSSSVLPSNDPTLLFVNSGMVQFKNIFLGASTEYTRVCTAQRCIRAGGKHNDLDDVGKDNYHHTFFEMLGNWSFGDYFKAEAIQYAYEFLVDELGLDRDRLYVTIYEEMDKESRELWSQYLDDSRIIAASYKDNFWEMGEYGPCGPCTEIHYDRIGNRDASDLVNKDDPNVIEIWNIVFMEYSRTPEGLIPLERKNIDTGIGLERLLSILMGVDSNYKVDCFKEITDFIETKCNHKFADGTSLVDVAFRVLADHSRTMAVCLHDGVEFSNTGVGYVLRRILRRAVRYAHEILSIQAGVLSKVVDCASAALGLTVDTEVVDREEALFLRTLKRGLAQFRKMVANKDGLVGEDVFILYDTYGFPKDLTELLAREQGVSISLDGFDEYQERARELSRGNAGRKEQGIAFEFERTDDEYKYETNGISATLQAVVQEEKVVEYTLIDTSKQCSIIFDKTCFYGEKGGQTGDSGEVYFYPTAEEADNHTGTLRVTDTQIRDGYVYHIGTVKGKLGEYAKLFFDEEKRARTRANHSTAHILYYYLRSLFDTAQQGSLVDSEKCRFDFSGEKLSEDTVKTLEKRINAFVKSKAKRTVRILSEEDARADPAVHLENEDYSSGVRIVEFSNGETAIKDACSGTHVETTEEIQLVRIISEGSIKAGIRRIVAFTGDAAKRAEENAEKAKEQVLQGRVMVVNDVIPLVEKMNLNEMIRKKQGELQMAIKEKVETASNELKEIILRVKEGRDGLLVKQVSGCAAFDSKGVIKIISSLGRVLLSENACGIVSAEANGTTHFAINTVDNKAALEKLSGEFGSGAFRLPKGTIVGTLPSSKYDVVVEVVSNASK